MTQNRCRLFRAVMATLPDPKPETPTYNVPWYNEPCMTKISIKNLMKETRIHSPKLRKMKSILDDEPDTSVEYVTNQLTSFK